MKFFLRGVIIAILSFSFCFTLHAELKKKWTFMVYLDGDSELEEQAINDFLEMAAIGTTSDVNIVALFDRSPANDDSYGNWSGTKQGVINQDDTPNAEWGTNVGSKNMGDPRTLVDFVDWAASNYTADNYALVLWDHETLLDSENQYFSGYTSILRDDTSSDILTTKEVRSAFISINKLQSIQGGFGADHITFFGIDSDMNQMVEVAYEWRSEVTRMDVLSASEAFDTANDGWQYAPILKALTSNPAMSAASLGKIIPENVNGKPSSSIRLNQMSALSDSISNMAKAMNEYWDDESEKGTIREKASAVKTIFMNALIAGNGPADRPWGMTINFPIIGVQDDYKESNIEFAGTAWTSFLSKFSAAMENTWIAEARDSTYHTYVIGADPNPIPYYDIYDFVSNIVGPYDFTVDPATLTIGEHGGTGTITCVLDAKPDSNVTIKATIINNKPVASEANASIRGGTDENGDGVADTISLVFTPDNWDKKQNVILTGEDDEYAGDDSCQVQFSINKAASDVNFGHVRNKLVNVTVVSDEKAEIKVTPHRDLPGIALKIDENGGTGTFDVKLVGKPRSSVHVKIANRDPEEISINYSTFSFDSDTYTTPQTLTVTAIDDPYVGNDTGDVVFSIGSGSDPQWSDTLSVVERVECTDDEGSTMTATFTMSPSTLTINEDPDLGNTKTFTVVLDGKPHVNVKINLESADTDAVTLDQKYLIFSPSNWKTAQTVTVTAVDDDLVGDQVVKVTGSVDPSSDEHFLTAPDQEVAVTIINNDTPGFKLKPEELTLKEDFDSKTFTVVLTKGPVSGDVQLDITSDDTDEATVSPAFLVFDKTNWNVPQKVKVTSVPDFLLADQVTYITVSRNNTNTDSQWGSDAPRDPADQKVKINLINDDVPGYKLSKTATTIDEGATGSYTVVLTARPAAGKTVTINAMSNNVDEVTLTGADALTFDNGNWNTPQAVSFFGVVDEYATDDTANIVNTVDTTVGTPDTDFNSLAAQTLAVTIENDNTVNSAELTLNVTTLTINEIAPGDSSNFTVMLDAKPHSNVVVKVNNKDPLEVAIDKTELTFTPSNWNVAQLVTVTSADNNYMGDGTANIELSVRPAVSDPTFKDAVTKTVTVTIIENDPADDGGVSNSEDGVVVLQNKGKGTFTVALTGRPRSDVVLNLVSADTGIATVYPSTMTFTTNSWATPKKVTVTGDPNNLAIANSEVIINVTADAASDAEWLARATFLGLNTAATRVTVTSDITGGFALTPDVMTIYEQNQSLVADKQFEVVLNQKPTGNVVLNIASDTPVSATVAPSQLTFTPADWYTPQAVTITSATTDLQTDVDLDVNVTVDATTADPNFLALPGKHVDVTVMNINPVAVDDTAEAINNKPGMVVANDPVMIRLLNNDTDPRGNDLTVKSVAVTSGGGSAVINPDKTTVSFTPVVDGTTTLSYVATNGVGGSNDDSPSATVTITTYNGQAVSLGSVVKLYNTDVPVATFTRRPSLYALYYDPIKNPLKDPTVSKAKKYTLKGLSKLTTALDVVDNEWKRKIRLYNQIDFNKAYKSGTSFDNFKGQVTSLLTDVYVKTTVFGSKIDAPLNWKILVKPPVISAVQRFTTPHDDLTAPTALWAGDLHAGSVMHLIGRYFGNKKPKVWVEYVNTKGSVKMARCKVLKYTPYKDSLGRVARSYMDVDPTSTTYSDSELKVRLPTKWPSDWDFSLNYTLVIDNGIGKASVGPFTTVAATDSNYEPTAVADTFNGANAVTADSEKNELDILDNDQFPNADYVDVKIVSPPDAGGKVTWNSVRGVLIYTPKAGFTGIETLTYKVIEKYTEQHKESSATVSITVN